MLDNYSNDPACVYMLFAPGTNVSYSRQLTRLQLGKISLIQAGPLAINKCYGMHRPPIIEFWDVFAPAHRVLERTLDERSGYAGESTWRYIKYPDETLYSIPLLKSGTSGLGAHNSFRHT
jgi:hypothetical protein